MSDSSKTLNHDELQIVQEKAATIVEAIPYIQRFAGERVVIKFGGHAMESLEIQENFARDVILMTSLGIQVIIVHGGGPQIELLLNKLGIQSTFRSGMRVTDDQIMSVVQMVLMGQVNPRIVSLIQKLGGRAVGLSGMDCQLLRSKRLKVDGEEIGRVGEVVRVNDHQLKMLSQEGIIPVISPIGIDPSTGESLNINADYAASAIAEHTLARKLVLMTDVDGIQGPDGELLSTLNISQAKHWIKEEVITGGMIPKLRCAFNAIERGVEKVHILNGKLRHALLLELFTNKGIGTEIIVDDD